ncbi:hypothetical protein FACS189459_7010 [Bacilli bacterium]|nr:hypothetical protein FACS189459_7010 [Bacilli bacterium]
MQKNINTNFKIICDHVKTCVMAIGDGALPSNKERGSVLRKLIRRAMVCGKKLNIDNFIIPVADAIIDTMSE